MIWTPFFFYSHYYLPRIGMHSENTTTQFLFSTWAFGLRDTSDRQSTCRCTQLQVPQNPLRKGRQANWTNNSPSTCVDSSTCQAKVLANVGITHLTCAKGMYEDRGSW